MYNGTKETRENCKDSFKLTCLTCWLRGFYGINAGSFFNFKFSLSSSLR